MSAYRQPGHAPEAKPDVVKVRRPRTPMSDRTFFLILCTLVSITVAAMVFATIWGIRKSDENIRKCEERGGTMISGQCVRVERIPIREE